MRAVGLGACALALIAATVPASAVAGETRSPDADVIDGSYVVLYQHSVANAGAATSAREAGLGFNADQVYRGSIEGFAADLDASQLRAISRDPSVAMVSPNRRVEATAFVPLTAGEPKPPNGIRRIQAARLTTAREASQVNAAVIDSGIRFNHPDLNVLGGRDCIDAGTPPTDGNGHGTHVAGTIAAANNGSGVVGVAPGTGLYAVRVLNNSGSGTIASVICGINWVNNNAAALNIGVANMSLGATSTALQTCAATTDAMHKAICRGAVRGIDFVVAAGNDGWDYDFPSQPNVPAVYPQVLTVTAVADSDGLPGALGPTTGCAWDLPDETPATFSNFALTAGGMAHTIAAPGTCIKSTWTTGFNTISGTSMASPHVAGVVALCMGEVGHAAGPCASRTPAQVITFLRNAASSYNTANPDYGFTGDPLHTPTTSYYGFLTRAPTPIP